MRFITLTIQYRVIVAENYRVLTCCVDVTYVIGHERDNNNFLHCIVPIQ